MKREELAKLVQMTPKKIAAFEHGECGDLTMNELHKLAIVLDVDPACIVTHGDIPKMRLLFLNDFIKYLSGKSKPKHYDEIKKLVGDSLASRAA